MLTRNKKIEVKIGDSGWIKVNEDNWNRMIRAWDAENIEERIWRPLETVIGWKEFKRVA